jgi:hypothetical protein
MPMKRANISCALTQHFVKSFLRHLRSCYSLALKCPTKGLYAKGLGESLWSFWEAVEALGSGT